MSSNTHNFFNQFSFNSFNENTFHLLLLFFLCIKPFNLYSQDLALDVDEQPKPSLYEKINKRRPMRFRNDTIMVKPRWFLPDLFKVQYAGNIGFMSIGGGYKFGNRYEPSLFCGLLNETLGDSRTSVWTISLKNSFNLTTKPIWNHFVPKAGLSVNWGHTNNTFNKLPQHYPDKYYFQNKIHIAPFWGGEWLIPFSGKYLKAGGIYFEFSTLDAYLLECIRTEYVTLSEIWNLALGFSLYIH